LVRKKPPPHPSKKTQQKDLWRRRIFELKRQVLTKLQVSVVNSPAVVMVVVPLEPYSGCDPPGIVTFT